MYHCRPNNATVLMKISCVFSKMQEFGHFPIISSLIDRLIFYQLVFDSFMFTSLVFICVGFSVIGLSVAGFTVTGFSDDGLANSGNFLKRSEFVFVVLLTPFSAWDMKTYKVDLGCGLQTKKSAIFDLYSDTKSVPSVQSRERHSLPPAIKIDRLIFDSMGISFFDNYFI